MTVSGQLKPVTASPSLPHIMTPEMLYVVMNLKAFLGQLSLPSAVQFCGYESQGISRTIIHTVLCTVL
jgi:hypothetical protein